MKNTVVHGDCRVEIEALGDNSVDLILTDPPYFLDGLNDNWDAEKLKAKKRGASVKSLPSGMKFDPQQGRAFQAFYEPIACQCFRVLKPGGFFLSFSQARLYHRMTAAMEDAGFDIRDMIGWTYEGQAKAFSQNHRIAKNKAMTSAEKAALIAELTGWKTPQLKPMIEPIALAQKPTIGTYVENWREFGVGLMNTNARLDAGKFPGNIISIAKPTKNEKGEFNSHLTVKPLRLIRHLIELFSREGAIVLDPFMGSGTTAVAAIETGRRFVGFERDPSHHAICRRRLNDAFEADLARTGRIVRRSRADMLVAANANVPGHAA